MGIHHGKIRDGLLYENMKVTRSIFRNSLNYYKKKKNENEFKNKAICKSFSKDKKVFWKNVNKIKNSGKCMFSVINGTSDPYNICEAFRISFGLTGGDKNNFLKGINSYFSSNFEFCEVSRNEVNRAIAKLNSGCNFYGIDRNHLTYASDILSGFLSKLFNSFLRHSFIPACVTLGEITPVIKNKLGNIHESKNYRPIMTSCNVFKIFEYVLLNRLQFSLKISNRQFGFTPNTSSLMCVTLIKECIAKYTNSGSYFYCAFLDLIGAFDNLDPIILIKKLYESDIPFYLVNIIIAIYKTQSSYIKLDSYKSSAFPVFKGVRQGGIISTILFNFYINTLVSSISKLDVGCYLNFNLVNIISYADDICLTACSRNGLVRLLYAFQEELKKLNLRININKSKVLIVPPYFKSVTYPLPNFYIDNCQLENVKSYKYLGVMIANDGSCDEDILRCEKSFLRQFHFIYRKFNFLNKNVFFHLFDIHCLSFYGSELWLINKNRASTFKAISVSFHNAIKKIFGIPRQESNHYICNGLNVYTFEHLINKKTINFFLNMSLSSSICFAPFIHYFNNYSYMYRKIKKLCNDKYSINDIFDNDRDAILSRIMRVQLEEQSSLPLFLREMPNNYSIDFLISPI